MIARAPILIGGHSNAISVLDPCIYKGCQGLRNEVTWCGGGRGFLQRSWSPQASAG
jgi:hypothetical protein